MACGEGDVTLAGVINTTYLNVYFVLEFVNCFHLYYVILKMTLVLDSHNGKSILERMAH